MELTIIHSTSCEDTACPTAYIDKATGNFILQGATLNPEEIAKMNIPDGESALLFTPEFIQALIEKVRNNIMG